MNAKVIKAGPEAYAAAVEQFRSERLVALPTETVYGLAGDACSDRAITQIYNAKGRPSYNPLITHILTPEHAIHYAEISDLATELMAQFWPGPLTLVLPRRDSNLSHKASAGLKTIAIRCPDSDWREGLIEAGWTGPLVMPSANRSGHVSPTEASHVQADLGESIDLIIDGGPCKAGLESTVISLTGNKPTILRDGALPRMDIETITGPLQNAEVDHPVASPGMLDRHYAPEATLRLNAQTAEKDEILIGFGPSYAAPTLSENGDLKEAAHNLYRLLRELDGPGRSLAVAPIPMQGLGLAINDRLRRAALGR